jgi:hypothetical protein
MRVQEPKFVTVVSGLPRSGTSMMMQMLEAGGLPVITDKIRAADPDNPLGYYEFEPVKHMMEYTTWLYDAYNKAVKIIYRLLYYLPPDHRYKIIFMRRDLIEVIASQNEMLRRSGRVGGNLPGDRLARAFQDDLYDLDRWLTGQDNFTVLNVSHRDVLYESRNTVTEVQQFLGYPLALEGMIKVIDRSLHRQR